MARQVPGQCADSRWGCGGGVQVDRTVRFRGGEARVHREARLVFGDPVAVDGVDDPAVLEDQDPVTELSEFGEGP